MKRTYSFIECNSCSFRMDWHEGWRQRFEQWRIRHHFRATGHTNGTIRQGWDWE